MLLQAGSAFNLERSVPYSLELDVQFMGAPTGLCLAASDGWNSCSRHAHLGLINRIIGRSCEGHICPDCGPFVWKSTVANLKASVDVKWCKWVGVGGPFPVCRVWIPAFLSRSCSLVALPFDVSQSAKCRFSNAFNILFITVSQSHCLVLDLQIHLSKQTKLHLIFRG